MGASNFHSVNATHIFAVEIEEDYEYQDLLMNLKSAITAHEAGDDSTITDPNDLRSYPSRVIGRLRKGDIVCGVEIDIEVYAVVRSGYYSGCCLDWVINYYLNNVESEESNIDYDESDVAQYLENYCDKTSKQAREDATIVLKRLNELKKEVVDDMEKIFADHSTPLSVAGTFSNGETIYSKINNNGTQSNA